MFIKKLLCVVALLAISIAIVSSRGDSSSCQGRCFESYNSSYPCQCTDDCASYSDCCVDYTTYCTQGNYSCLDRCGIYDGSKPCQCDSGCGQFSNCCPDYIDQCSTILNITCQGRCATYDPTWACQCDSTCISYDDCCPDYLTKCGIDSCKGRCGQAFDEDSPCQCNSECSQFDNCCADIVDVCANSITDAELQQLSQQIWDADADRLTVTIALQGLTPDGSSTDNAPQPLCTTIPSEINTLPIYTTLQNLFDNYNADETIVETSSPAFDQEIDAFLTEIVASQPMTLTFNYLVSKGIVPNSVTQFQATLKTIWFTLYNRQDVLSSSGAEDVLVGEYETLTASVGGLYNWVRFCTLEQAGEINYLGYVKSQDFNGATLVRFPYNWGTNFKPVGELLIGSSPAFDLSVYTLCYYSRPNALCSLVVNSLPLTIQSYVNTYNRVEYVGTAYPAY